MAVSVPVVVIPVPTVVVVSAAAREEWAAEGNRLSADFASDEGRSRASGWRNASGHFAPAIPTSSDGLALRLSSRVALRTQLHRKVHFGSRPRAWGPSKILPLPGF